MSEVLLQNDFPVLSQTTPDKATTVSRKHLEDALHSSAPSISASERLRLARAYHEFAYGRKGKFPSGVPSDEIGGRSTLM